MTFRFGVTSPDQIGSNRRNATWRLTKLQERAAAAEARRYTRRLAVALATVLGGTLLALAMLWVTP